MITFTRFQISDLIFQKFLERMSHWFHRNKLKGTIAQKFDGKGIAVKTPAEKMLQDLRSTRANLLQLFTDEVATPENVMEKANAYFELLVGLSDVESR